MQNKVDQIDSVCLKCSTNCHRKNELVRHINKIKNCQAYYRDNVKLIDCESCDKVFLSKKGVKLHNCVKYKDGCSKCSSRYDCNCCELIIESDTVHNRPDLRIKGKLTCQTTWAIYLIVHACGLVYVGQTTATINKRICEHRKVERASKKQNFIQSGGAADHFRSCRGLGFRVQVLECVEACGGCSGKEEERKDCPDCRRLLDERERYYQRELNSFAPTVGFNKK